MCGIFGVVGVRHAADCILNGLARLEYRGYDSAGLAIVAEAGIQIEKATGSVAQLRKKRQPYGTVGIGHTRWATHGPPTEVNAHPHRDCSGRIAVVHNGIVENYDLLREKLTANGHVFTSDTDTEVIAHLVEEHFSGDMVAAVRSAAAMLEGSYALGIVSADAPGRIIAARRKSPLLIGLQTGRNYVASDAVAILPHSRRVIFMEDHEVAEVTADRIELFDERGHHKIPIVHALEGDAADVERGDFEHYMLKEIHDIPHALRSLFNGRIETLGERFDLEGTLTEYRLRSVSRMNIVACGTSHYAGMVGKGIIERLSGIPVEVHLASEHRYAPLADAHDTLGIYVSQSGETADTLEAMRRAKEEGGPTLAIVNVAGSSLAREADGVFHLRAGPEVSVASTKAFVNMVGAFYLLGAHLGRTRGRLGKVQADDVSRRICELPDMAQRVLENQNEIRKLGERFFRDAPGAFFLGRQVSHGLAMEAALKLKEIGYVYAEGHAAGELKHGPLALLQDGVPVTALVPPRDDTHGVMLSNILEVKARGAKVLGIVCEGDERAAQVVDETISVPCSDPLFYPIPACVAVYLLTYHAARARGCAIDKPRNLAKSVTVE